jgi:hypothetical protein
MPDAVRDLDAAQRWMLNAITAGEPGDGHVDDVIVGSAELSAARRIDIYRRGYRARLVDCLRKTHPGLRHALGEQVFEAFALDYLATNPSRSYTLGRLGARWWVHLEETRPDHDARWRESWPDFLVDLARLESVFQEVYDGPGAEGQLVVDPEGLPDEPWSAGTVRPVGCLRLLSFRFPVAGYLGAVRRGDHPPLPGRADSWVVVNRNNWVVTFTELGSREYAALAALIGGENLENVSRTVGFAIETLWELLRDWAGRGFLQSVDPSDGGVVQRWPTSEVLS